MSETDATQIRTFHLCQSVRGALKNWSASEFRHMAKHNNCTVNDVKNYFMNCLAEGKEVIPIGECDNFSFKDGCMGHIKEPQVTKTEQNVSNVNLSNGE